MRFVLPDVVVLVGVVVVFCAMDSPTGRMVSAKKQKIDFIKYVIRN